MKLDGVGGVLIPHVYESTEPRLVERGVLGEDAVSFEDQQRQKENQSKNKSQEKKLERQVEQHLTESSHEATKKTTDSELHILDIVV